MDLLEFTSLVVYMLIATVFKIIPVFLPDTFVLFFMITLIIDLEFVFALLWLTFRRRQGEVSKMKLDDFLKRHKTKVTDLTSISEMEKHLCKIFEVVEIVGKRGRTVPVLLTPNITEQLQLLVQHRESIGIVNDNPYLFPRAHYNSMSHIRASDCIRKLAQGVTKNPENIRSTKLRKQVATASQMLSLKENELDLLAGYMGHDIRVHKEYYTLPDEVARVTKLSRLFLLMEKGTLKAHSGKSLDDLPINDDIDNSEESSDEDAMDETDDLVINTNTELSSGKANNENCKSNKKVPWNEEEKVAIMSLRTTLQLRLSGKSDIENLQKKFPILRSRSWRNIKDYCRNNKEKILRNRLLN